MSVVTSGAEVVRVLRGLGFEEVGQKGSHLKMRKENRTVIIPMHDELRIGTLRSILRQAGLSMKQLEELL
jgi:predicted RNA binding protein YcfA (HicA-like mRNA interferase family)